MASLLIYSVLGKLACVSCWYGVTNVIIPGGRFGVETLDF